MSVHKSFTELYSAGKPVLSFEFFPPRETTAAGETEQLIKRLSALKPDYMTVTYGAGGGTRAMTRHLVRYIHTVVKIPAVAHLTCVAHTKEELSFLLDGFKAEGVSHILALRGDPPKGMDSFVAAENGFTNAQELTNFIKQKGGFSVAVAGYPEVHRDAISPQSDIDYLKSKVDAGAEIILTQLFFEPEVYFRFVDRARSAGITAPIVPGVMPIANAQQLKKFTSLCGATIPERIQGDLEPIAGDLSAVVKYGIQHAIWQCEELLKAGVPGIHLYTLNRSSQIEPIVMALRDKGFL